MLSLKDKHMPKVRELVKANPHISASELMRELWPNGRNSAKKRTVQSWLSEARQELGVVKLATGLYPASILEEGKEIEPVAGISLEHPRAIETPLPGTGEAHTVPDEPEPEAPAPEPEPEEEPAAEYQPGEPEDEEEMVDMELDVDEVLRAVLGSLGLTMSERKKKAAERAWAHIVSSAPNKEDMRLAAAIGHAERVQELGKELAELRGMYEALAGSSGNLSRILRAERDGAMSLLESVREEGVELRAGVVKYFSAIRPFMLKELRLVKDVASGGVVDDSRLGSEAKEMVTRLSNYGVLVTAAVEGLEVPVRKLWVTPLGELVLVAFREELK